MVRGTPNVVRRGGRIHFRRQVPKHLVSRLGRREITASLRTGDIRLARVRSRRLYVATEVMFSLLERPMLSPEVVARVVRDFYDLVAQIDNMSRLASPPLNTTEHEEMVALLKEHREVSKGELGRGDFTVASLAAAVAITRSGLDLDPLERRQLEQSLMRAGIEATSDAEARLSGDFTYRPLDPLFDRPIQRAAQVADPGDGYSSPLGAVPVALAVSRKQGKATPFLTLTSRFLDHQGKGRLWDPQTVLQAKKSYALFVELCGDKAPAAYQRPDATRFKEALQSLPADYGKAAEFRGRSIHEIMERDGRRSGNQPRLSTRTVKRHFSALSSFWRWAIAEGQEVNNPFTGFTFPSALRANEQRDMWTEEELKALFATPVWRGCHSAGRRSTPGSFIVKDEKYWLPLIALYSGLRQEEAAQLYLEDIRKVDGHLVFDINGRPPRKLKNRNAVRKVPVHSRLLSLGLLQYIKEQKDKGSDVLFPELKPGGADGRLGHAFSKWFARYRRDVGLYRKGLDFHSFRHTATTMMQRAGVAIAAIDEVTGHATPGETARYSHGLTTAQLVEAVESIKVDVLS